MSALLYRQLLHEPTGRVGVVVDAWEYWDATAHAKRQQVRLAFDSRNHHNCPASECTAWMPPFAKRGPQLVWSKP